MQISKTSKSQVSTTDLLEKDAPVMATSLSDYNPQRVMPGDLYEVDSRKPITSKLKSLRKGDSVSFPIERRQSVYAVASRLRKELIKWAWNFKLIDDTENFKVTIVRIS